MDQPGVISYVPILIAFIVALLTALGILLASSLLGSHHPTLEKLSPYECGVDPVGSSRDRQSVKFYLVAMIFLLFDIEAVFLIPWAVGFHWILKSDVLQPLRFVYYGEMVLFIFILLTGLIYVWKKGLLNWNR